MLTREDFYAINQQTLDNYFVGGKKIKLYIYPELNAIVTKRPSKKVKKYLYVEYKVNASLLKRIAVYLYTRLTINSFGVFAKKTCNINGDFSNDCLIYPCNKKIRIFNFKNNTVRVIPKATFPDVDIRKEIAFRTQNKAEFIPEILSFEENNYTEKIIDGYPLAREKEKFEFYKEKAYKIWGEYIASNTYNVTAKEYVNKLRKKFENLLIQLSEEKNVDKDKIVTIENKLFELISTFDEDVEVGLSHGDLQPGNIWIENNTNKIYIIDWEAYDERCLNYDYIVLNNQIRRTDGLSKFISILNESVQNLIVLYEDLLFKINELNSLPQDFGKEDFANYIEIVFKGIGNV